MSDFNRIPVGQVADIVAARQRGRELARRLGFSDAEATLVATIISELARNIIHHAGCGEIVLESAADGERVGLRITGQDTGPGIDDLERALAGGYSTTGGLGLGLSGVRRIADHFEIDSRPRTGTTVTATKWRS